MSDTKILVVDDAPDIREILEVVLSEYYKVVTASSGKEAVDKIRLENPALVVLDFNLPDTTGVEVCKEIRKDPLFLHLPIIMLTGRAETHAKVEGLDAGVDDYVVKPFNADELLARIRMVLSRSQRDLDANPLTRLPGNVTITNEINHRLGTKHDFSFLYLDLDNFKAINDFYGFSRGDDVIKETARTIITAVQKVGTSNDFIGHVGGDDFVVITEDEKAETLAKTVIEIFEKTVPKFYDEPQRLQGYIEAKDRQGTLRKFGFLSISIGIVETRGKNYTHAAQISSLGAELKEYVKKMPGSNYVKERRTPDA